MVYGAEGTCSEDKLDCKQSLIFFFAKLLHAKPKHVSGEAACRGKRGRLDSIPK